MKKILSFTMTLCLIIALATLCAGAAGGDPMDLHWDGLTARWLAPADPVNYYRVALKKNGGFINEFQTGETAYAFADTIKGNGSGDYTFDVCAVFEDASESKVVSSPVYTYNEAHPHPLHYVAFRDATCAEDGVKEHFECPVCDAYYWDAMAQQLIPDKSEVVIPAIGHDWGEWEVTKKATETQEGEAKRVCKRDASHVETKKLPKQAPVTEAPTNAPTNSPTGEQTTSEIDPFDVTTATAPKASAAAPVSDRSNSSNSGLTMVLIISGIVLLVVVPLVIILIVVINKKNKNQDPPEPPKNGSEYLPVQQRYGNGQNGYNQPYPPQGQNGYNPPYPPQGQNGYNQPYPPQGQNGYNQPYPPQGQNGYNQPYPPQGQNGYRQPYPENAENRRTEEIYSDSNRQKTKDYPLHTENIRTEKLENDAKNGAHYRRED